MTSDVAEVYHAKQVIRKAKQKQIELLKSSLPSEEDIQNATEIVEKLKFIQRLRYGPNWEGELE